MKTFPRLVLSTLLGLAALFAGADSRAASLVINSYALAAGGGPTPTPTPTGSPTPTPTATPTPTPTPTATPAGWSELTQGSLLAWWKADAQSYSNGAAVTSFVDSSPNGYNLTGNGPIFQTSQVNSKPALYFDGTTRLNSGGPSSNTLPFTITVVAKVTDLTSTYPLVGSDASAAVYFAVQGSTGLLKLSSYSVADVGFSTTAITAGVWHVLTVEVSATNYAFFIDGVAAGSGTHSTYFTSVATNFTMGVQYLYGSPNDYLNGKVAEVQIFSSYFGTTDINGQHTKLSGKYATP